MTRPIALGLSVEQLNYLCHELLGLLDDYTQRQLIEPEDKAAIRQVVNDWAGGNPGRIHIGRKLADAKLQLDLAQLRKHNSPTPNDKNS